MSDSTDKLIVALDVPSAREAFDLVDLLGDTVTFYKVGMQLYFAEGNSFVRGLKGRRKKVFLDLKINDIPETVAKAVASVAKLEVDYLTLFTNAAQITSALAELKTLGSDLKLLNVTVLTSEASDFSAVKSRAELSLNAGAHGLISSGQETAALRQAFGKNAIIVNPGIRPLEGKSDDQVRIVTPTIAILAGATNLVVGRPITRAGKPREAAQKIVREILEAENANRVI
jgi:orotidine-5'-phosphate decarboxylase